MRSSFTCPGTQANRTHNYVMRTLFSVDGPVMRVMTDIMNLLILNLLTLLCCLPLVTAGAALAAMHYILMQMGEEKDGKIVRTYFTQFKANLRNATAPWLILLIFAVLLYLDYRVFSADERYRMLVIPAYIGAVVLAMIYVWLFPLLARFENRCFASLKNAVLMALAYFPRTIAMAAISAVVPFILTQSIRLFPLAIFFGISLPAYLCMFLYKKVMKELVEHALGEKDSAERPEDSADERD